MAGKAGRVVLGSRFSPGTMVSLWRVADESVLRHEGGELVATRRVPEDGRLVFDRKVGVGDRFIAFGYEGGAPVSVRLVGAAGDDGSLGQPPVGNDVVRHADGTPVGESPKVREDDVPSTGEFAPRPGQQHVGDDVLQRSSTPMGEAHPVSEGERAPYPSVEDGPEVKASDTELGRATAAGVPPAQEDVKDGTVQRSDTETGYATPIVAADPEVPVEELKGADLAAKLVELGIDGSGMSADEKRAAVAARVAGTDDAKDA